MKKHQQASKQAGIVALSAAAHQLEQFVVFRFFTLGPDDCILLLAIQTFSQTFSIVNNVVVVITISASPIQKVDPIQASAKSGIVPTCPTTSCVSTYRYHDPPVLQRPTGRATKMGCGTCVYVGYRIADTRAGLLAFDIGLRLSLSFVPLNPSVEA
jgi:hypothetical protein